MADEWLPWRPVDVTDRERLEEAVRAIGVRETARQVKIGQSAIHGLITGKRTGCTAATAERLAEVVGIDRDYLFAPRTGSQDARDVAPEHTSAHRTA